MTGPTSQSETRSENRCGLTPPVAIAHAEGPSFTDYCSEAIGLSVMVSFLNIFANLLKSGPLREQSGSDTNINFRPFKQGSGSLKVLKQL